MSLTITQLQTLNDLFKPVYADAVVSLIPSRELFTLTVPFQDGAEKGGGADYIVPLILNREHGATFHGSNDANLLLNVPTTTKTSQARVRSSAITMRSILSTNAANRAVKGDSSFVDATSYVIENLVESFSAIIEQINWYGGSGLAQLASAVGEIGTNVPGYTFDANGVDAALNAVRVSFAEWAPAIFIGAEDMPIEIHNAAGTVLVQRAEIKGVDILNRILILSDVGSISAASGANVGLRIWRKGTKGYEADGVHTILSATGSLFGVAAGTTGLWLANQYNVVGGTLDFASLSAGVQRAYARGLESSLQLHVNSSQFGKMMQNFLTTKVVAGGATLSTTTNEANVGGCCTIDKDGNLVYGMRTMKFIINSIEVEVVVNDYVKGGFAYGLDIESWRRVGDHDMEFDTKGLGDGQYFSRMSEMAAIEIRMTSDQAPFTARPARNIIFSGLTA